MNTFVSEEKAKPKCAKCPHRPTTYDEWVFRRGRYSTCCPNAYEEVAVHCGWSGDTNERKRRKIIYEWVDNSL